MGDYDRLVKDFFRKVNPSNPLHYYGCKRIVREEENRKCKDKANKANNACGSMSVCST